MEAASVAQGYEFSQDIALGQAAGRPEVDFLCLLVMWLILVEEA
jgi:hypothetical protein